MSELHVNRIQSQSGLPIEMPTGIGYTPAGAGAVATTVESKLRQFVSVKDFGAVGDGVTDDTAAFMSAISQHGHVYIPDGVWNVKNVAVKDCTLEFLPGAHIITTLGATDNCIRMSSNSRIINPRITVTNSVAPPHGGYGSAIAIGYYADISEYETNIRIESPVLTCKNTTRLTLAISVLGNVSDIDIVNPIVRGAFGIAFQAHWGGVFDESDPHNSTVTSSRAPNNIRVNGLKAEPDNGNVGEIVVTLSGVFDVRIDNTVSDGWRRALLLTPGDVYAQVASSDQASKIMTGIVLDGIRVSNPPSNSGVSAVSLMFIAGLSATIRTALGRTFASDGYCGVTIKNVSFDTSLSYAGAPLAYLYYASKTDLHIKSITGFEASTAPLVQMLGADNCRLSVDSVFQPLASAVVVNESVNCDISVNAIGNSTTAESTHAKAFSTGFIASVDVTLGAAVVLGDTTVTLNAIAGSYSLMAGTRFYFGTSSSFLTVAKSVTIGESGTTVVQIAKSAFALASGSSLSIRRNLVNSNVEIRSLSTYIAAEFFKADSVKISANCNQSSKYDILVAGSDNRNLVIKGVFNGCGSGNATGATANIAIAGGENILITESTFETTGTALVTENIHAPLSTGLSSLKVTANHFGGATQRAVSLPNQTDAASSIGKNQVWGNSIKEGLPLLLETIVTGCVVANKFFGAFSTASAPTTGTWSVGDRVYDSTPAIGQPKSWVCTVAGTPGTWVSEGNL